MSRRLICLTLLLVICVCVSLFAEKQIAANFGYYYDILMSIGINIVLATSLNLVNGYTGQFSLGHAGFMAIGAYTSATWSKYVDPVVFGVLGGSASPLATNFTMFFSLLFAGILAAIAGFAVGVPSLRLKGDYLAIVTLGFGEIIRVAILNMDFLGAARGFNGIPLYTNLFWTFGSAVLCVYVVVSLVHSTYGRGFLTVRDDEVAAEAMGINTTRYKVVAFVVASFFAGVAGALFAHLRQYITPDGFNFYQSVDVVVIVILGGMGNTAGVVVAAILLTILPEFLRSLAHTQFVPVAYRGLLENRLIPYSLLLIIMMLTRPQGLFGDGTAFKKWFRRSRPRVLSSK